MSFMLGFGDSFSRSFEAGLARKERRREDLFKIKFDEYKSQREARDKQTAKAEKNAKKAKALVEGIPGIPQGAWMNAYEWLNAELSEEEVVRRLKEGTFNASELPAGQVSSASRQTEEALAASQTPEPTKPASTAAPAQTPSRPQVPAPTPVQSQAIGPDGKPMTPRQDEVVVANNEQEVQAAERAMNSPDFVQPGQAPALAAPRAIPEAPVASVQPVQTAQAAPVAPRPSAPIPAAPVAEEAPANSPEAVAAPRNPIQQAGRAVGGFLGGTGLFTTEEDYANEVLQRIATATGTSVDEVRSVYDSIPEGIDTSSKPSWTPGFQRPDTMDLADANLAMMEARTPEEYAWAKRHRDAQLMRQQQEQLSRGRGDQAGSKWLVMQDQEGKGQIVQARPALGGGWEDLNGNRIEGSVAAELSGPAEEAWKKVLASFEKKEVQQYMTKANALNSMYRSGGVMVSLAEQSPAITADMTSTAVSTAQKWLADAMQGLDLVSSTSQQYGGDTVSRILERVGSTGTIDGSTIQPEEAQDLRNVEARLKALMGENANDLGLHRALYNTQVALFAYDLGRAYGQEGRSLAEAERKMFTDLARSGITPERLKENLGSILNGLKADITREGSALAEFDSASRAFEAVTGTKAPIDPIPSFNDLMTIAARDPDTAEGHRIFSDVRTPGRAFNDPAPAKPKAPQARPVGSVRATGRQTPDGRPLLVDENGTIFVGN